ncbi:hypothetical protein B0H13DRAFT_1619620 [Mycena leptocephala]|nr:hypothetical protein B0H13DRAFT_1619620 [Mycena leptocephala]
MASSRDPKSNTLPRGQACFSCRRRKMRCDGAHPICGQCERGNRPDDCEYTHGQKRARAEMLQESISRVESRIFELENPHRSPPAVPLHQPYQFGTAPRPSLPQPKHEPWAAADEPPSDIVQTLVDLFLSYSSEFGFFLNGSRFRQSALLHQPMGHHARPTPALLSAVYLCASRLSKQPRLIAQEPVFLSRALDLTAKGLSGSHPHRVMHNLQAEILLAYYFFACGRFLEGKYHTASAMSLGLSSGLHMIRSANAPLSGNLPPAQDAIEEGERIHACWVGMILDKVWAVALSETPHIDHQHQNSAVDTPWPLEMDDYAKGLLSPPARYTNTLQKFVNSVPTSDTGMSTIAMLSKASVLWQRSDGLARDWKPGIPFQSAAFQDSFAALDGLIDSFRAALIPPNRILHPTPAMTRALVVAHSIAHTATIQLHRICPCRRPQLAQKVLVAATSVLNIIVSIPLQHFAFINPIMGVSVAPSAIFLSDTD